MELYKQTEDITVIGKQVPDFPDGINNAFGSLMKTLGSSRAYYGVSWMNDKEEIEYYAMAAEAFPGEGKQYHYELLTIQKGDYLAEPLHNWRSKTDCIKDVFHRLMADNKPDKNHPCIEWYQSDEEMLCMIKAL